MEFANIINMSRFCTDDGPGIRTTVFLKGCPLRCAWCHNPESQDPQPQILWDKEHCTNCGHCAAVCPTGAHKISGGQHRFDRQLCARCGQCAERCPTEALELSGRRVSTLEVFEEIEKDSVFYRNSGGGVTISGGEPLAQPAFTTELLQLCRQASIHTAVETSGFASKTAWEWVLPHCDLVLFDIKETDTALHRTYTAVPLEPILENLRFLDKSGVATLLRAPIIPGWNDRHSHLIALWALAKSLHNCQGVQIMPYHSMGAYKYARLQRPYTCIGVPEPDPDTIALWRSIAE